MINIILLIVWTISGVLTIVNGFHDDERKVPVSSYILLWIVFLLELIKIIIIEGF